MRLQPQNYGLLKVSAMKKIHIKATYSLLLGLFLLTTGCSTTTTYSGDWSGWSKWEETDKTKEFRLLVDSTPSHADLYIDEEFVATTPVTIRLSHPVLRSRSHRHRYEELKPGLDAYLEDSIDTVLFGRKRNPRVKKIGHEEKEKFKDGEETYEFMLKKAGYMPLVASLGIPLSQDSITFDLKEKQLLRISRVTVNNNYELTFLEKLYEFLYEDRFSIDCQNYNFGRIISKSEPLKEVFNITSSYSNYHYTLKINLTIERENTTVQAQILNPNNTVIVTDQLDFPTNEFCNLVKNKLNAIADNMAKKFLTH
jgi:hypothetical protein